MDPSYQLLAAKYIRRQAKQLAEQLDGLRAAKDIEFVHRARVATRRLRAALKMFDDCFPSEQLRCWRKAIRRTTTKLGSARDRDVQIEFLCGTLSALTAKECFPGIASVLVQLERQRERLQRNVVKAVDRLEADGTLREMRRLTRRILHATAPEAKTVQTPAGYAQTEQHILRQLERLLLHQDSLANPDDRQRHHAMRIAAKRLRYTLEIAKFVYPGQLDEAVEAIKKIQSLLGDVHDCDVWIEDLNAFAARQRDRVTALFGHAGRLVRLRPGIEYLREDRRRHRQAVFKRLVEYWAELGRRRFWDGLVGAVMARGQGPAAAETRPSVEESRADLPTENAAMPNVPQTEHVPLPNAPGLRSQGNIFDPFPEPRPLGVAGGIDAPMPNIVRQTPRKSLLTAGS